MRILLNFQFYKDKWVIHALAEDCQTPVSPFRDVATEETLLRLLRYLGATEESMDEAQRDIRRWRRGSVWIDVPNDRLAKIGANQSD